MSQLLIIVYFIISESHHTLQKEDIIILNMEYTTEKEIKNMPSHIHVDIYGKYWLQLEKPLIFQIERQ